ncbi:MAG TPA: hypothetical protein VGP17_08615 [Solirubrobacteraceae bacterium]|jgi:hypothetical protein|nr:hypothetical protein [Solirubrobacteraceae bacterium]
MSDLLASIKADLSSRRMLPLLGLAAIALLGAIAYVALGAKSGNPSPPSSASTNPQHVASLPGPALSSAPANPNAAVSETTVGAKYQHGGKTRNPFTPLKDKSSQSHSAATQSSSGSSPSSGSSTGTGSGSSTPSGGSQPTSGGGSSTPPSSSISSYHVDVALQQLSEEGNPVGKVQTFQDVAELRPLPSKHKALVEPTSVVGGGAEVAFILMRPEIIHGNGKCVPSAADCQAIDLKLHASEELQYQEEDGTVLVYRLTVTKIEKVSGSSASAASAHSSAAGSALITRLHLTIPSSAAFGGSLGTIVGGVGGASAHAARHPGHPSK